MVDTIDKSLNLLSNHQLASRIVKAKRLIKTFRNQIMLQEKEINQCTKEQMVRWVKAKGIKEIDLS